MAVLYLLLKDHTIRPTRNVLKWAERMASADRQVGLTRIGKTVVSTVFTGANTSVVSSPQVFETAVASNGGWDIVERYSSWTAAEEGHKKHVTKQNQRN